MTDKEYNVQKKRIEKYINKWQGPMGLKWFSIQSAYCREHRDGLECDICADTEVLWEYRKAVITYYIPKIETITDGQLEDVIVHELCHVLLGGLKRDDTPREVLEYTTQLVADSMQWVRAAGKRDK